MKLPTGIALIYCVVLESSMYMFSFHLLLLNVFQNTHREPIEMVQSEAWKRKPITDPDRPSVSVRLFNRERREVVLDLPRKKPHTPETLTQYDPEKFKVDPKK